jgi:2-polyprenyl-6-methoxyphenol hydroxylase-like FAD-dependent oxidoreductase
VFAPKGYGAIIHVMEFKWDHSGELKNNIGGNDAELIAKWPGLLFDNTRDYVNWGFSAATSRFPKDVVERRGEDLIRLVLDMTPDWHPNMRTLFRWADPTTCVPIAISTSVPVPQWQTTNVTLLGDAIHTMTAGRGVGANTALRDAAMLTRKLSQAAAGEKTLRQGVHEYEAKMIDYGFRAVLDSKKQQNGDSPLHRPVVGRVALAGLRIGMRAVNHLPPVKRKMTDGLYRYRGAERADE